MKKSIIQKTVDETNAAALAQYESSVKLLATTIQTAQKNIVAEEARFVREVASQATYIAGQRAALAKLTPPPVITAVEIFGAEVVEAATE